MPPETAAKQGVPRRPTGVAGVSAPETGETPALGVPSIPGACSLSALGAAPAALVPRHSSAVESLSLPTGGPSLPGETGRPSDVKQKPRAPTPPPAPAVKPAAPAVPAQKPREPTPPPRARRTPTPPPEPVVDVETEGFDPDSPGQPIGDSGAVLVNSPAKLGDATEDEEEEEMEVIPSSLKREHESPEEPKRKKKGLRKWNARLHCDEKRELNAKSDGPVGYFSLIKPKDDADRVHMDPHRRLRSYGMASYTDRDGSKRTTHILTYAGFSKEEKEWSPAVLLTAEVFKKWSIEWPELIPAIVDTLTYELGFEEELRLPCQNFIKQNDRFFTEYLKKGKFVEARKRTLST